MSHSSADSKPPHVLSNEFCNSDENAKTQNDLHLKLQYNIILSNICITMTLTKKLKQVQIEIVGTYITSTENRANYYIPSFRISKENL